jgi:hypothetical protein
VVFVLNLGVSRRLCRLSVSASQRCISYQMEGTVDSSNSIARPSGMI